MQTIKNISLAIVLLCCTSGCGESLNFKYEVPVAVIFDVPQSEINQFTELTVTIENVITDFAPFLEANGTAANQVTSVQPGRCILSSAFGNVDMGFLNEISVRARSNSDPNRVEEIFYFTDFRFQEGPDVPLISSAREVSDIMSEPTIDIDVVMTFQGNPSVGNVAMDLDFTYIVFDQ